MNIINFKYEVENKFRDIINNKQLCDHKLSELSELISQVESKYSILYNKINTSIIGIDSFNFQNKLF